MTFIVQDGALQSVLPGTTSSSRYSAISCQLQVAGAGAGAGDLCWRGSVQAGLGRALGSLMTLITGTTQPALAAPVISSTL